MTCFRVTKYNPEYRIENGAYSRDEWTSISDIGKVYDGNVFKLTDYLRVENDYIKTVRSFIASLLELDSMKIADLEVHEKVDFIPWPIRNETITRLSSVRNNIEVRDDNLEWVVRLALREVIWCRLQGPQGLYVHFGYDYYMYIGSEEIEIELPPLPSGIFVELCESPYRVNGRFPP